MNDQQPLLLSQHENYCTLTLNRPERLNAFTPALQEALMAALSAAATDDDCRAVLITGNGRGFCAGQDLTSRDPNSGEAPDLYATLDRLYNPMMRLIHTMPKPVVCAVNGVAAGAGANFALAADLVLAAKSAKFIQAFSKLGLVPDAGGSWTLTQKLGVARSKGLTLLGEPLTAEQALDWGLIWAVHNDDALMPAAHALMAQLAQGPTQGYALTKQLIHQAVNNSFAEQLNAERDAQAIAGNTADYREGVRAFLDKRAPNFTGK